MSDSDQEAISGEEGSFEDGSEEAISGDDQEMGDALSEEGDGEPEDDQEEESQEEIPIPKKKRKVTKKGPVLSENDDLTKELRRRGVLYISRVPPLMKPHHLRLILSEWAPLKRIYMAEESDNAFKARKKAGGNRRKLFCEAWVEFESKKDAIKTATALNGERIGQGKKDRWHDDLWSMRYLKHFKWNHLTEELRMKARVQEKKLQNEITAAKREANAILANRDKDIVVQKITEKKEKQGKEVKQRPEVEYKQEEELAPKNTVDLDEDFFKQLLGSKKRKREDTETQ